MASRTLKRYMTGVPHSKCRTSIIISNEKKPISDIKPQNIYPLLFLTCTLFINLIFSWKKKRIANMKKNEWIFNRIKNDMFWSSVVNKCVLSTLSNIHDRVSFSENDKRLLAEDYLHKKTPPQMFDRSLTTLLDLDWQVLKCFGAAYGLSID